MKILFLFTYNKGLLSNFFIDLGQQLIQHGHMVEIYSLKKHPRKLNVGEVNVLIEKKGGYLRNYFNIYKVIKRTSPDAIISNFSYANPSLLAGKILGIKKNIVWVHSLKEHGDPWKYQIYLKGLFYNCASDVIVNSYILQEELIQVFKVKKPKIQAIPFWSNIGRLKSSSIAIDENGQNFRIGCPGRFTVIKNQAIILKALYNLINMGCNDVEVYFAGEGPTHEDLKTKVKELGLNNKVNFLGILSAEQMRNFYKKMDLIVLPSLFESFGLVFIETISLDVPVVVSNKFGALDFVNKEPEEIREIIFDPKDSLELASKIEKHKNTEECQKGFFRNIYTKYFDRNLIFNRVLEVLNS